MANSEQLNDGVAGAVFFPAGTTYDEDIDRERYPDAPQDETLARRLVTRNQYAAYYELIPSFMDYSDPEAYGESLRAYHENLVDRAGMFIPGGFDPDTAPTYRELYGGYQIEQLADALLDFGGGLLLVPPGPPPGTSSHSPNLCLPAGRQIAFVEIAYCTREGETLYDRPTNQYREFRGGGTQIIRVWFNGAISPFPFDRFRDARPTVIPGFECPQACADAGLTGGCTRVISTPVPNPVPGADYVEHRLELSYGGVSYLIYSWSTGSFTEGMATNREGWTIYQGYQSVNINYRVIWNPPYNQPIIQPPIVNPPPPFMPESNCCSCRRIAGMLALHAVATTAANAAMLFAHFSGLVILLAEAVALLLEAIAAQTFVDEIGDFAAAAGGASLFDRLLRTADLINAIANLITAIRNLFRRNYPPADEGNNDVDLSPITRRLDAIFINVAGTVDADCNGDFAIPFSGISTAGIHTQLNALEYKLQGIHRLLCDFTLHNLAHHAVATYYENCEPGTLEATGYGMQIINAQFQMLFKLLEKHQKELCDNPPVAAVPEFWQVKLGANRPQLVLLFGQDLGENRVGRTRWALTIPHYIGSQGVKPNIPSYKKGQFEGILTLKDNSKVIVNCASEAECLRLINAIKVYIDRTQLEGSFYKVGRRAGQQLLNVKVRPCSAKFFSTGQKNLKPDWVLNWRR